MPQDYATAMFRVFQEILTNIARHAGAKEVHAECSDWVQRNGELVRTIAKVVAVVAVQVPEQMVRDLLNVKR